MARLRSEFDSTQGRSGLLPKPLTRQEFVAASQHRAGRAVRQPEPFRSHSGQVGRLISNGNDAVRRAMFPTASAMVEADVFG